MDAVWRAWRKIILIALLWVMVALPAFAAPPGQSGPLVHVVQAGETLYAIAQRYGVTVDAIVAANGLLDPNQIEVGRQLEIPGDVGEPSSLPAQNPPLVYIVQPGDTLALIARRYGTDVTSLAQLNHLANPGLIYVGQTLLLMPAGDTSTPAAGQVHAVQPGDTMARIAARYGVSVWAIAQANQIANPGVIRVGQQLFIPTETSVPASSLPLPFLSLSLAPVSVVQGQTVQVVVETDGAVSLSGTYDGQPLFWVGDQGHYRTLIGVHAMSAAGSHALDLKAIQGEREVSVHSMVMVMEAGFGVQYLSFSPAKSALLEPDLVTEEAERVWQVTTQATLPGQWQGAFGMPLAGDPSVSAPFGIRRSYGGGPANSYHSGVDFGVSEGTPVYCPARGKVVLAEPLQVRGQAVIVDHGRGVMTGYWHLSQIDVTVGQVVGPGDRLGSVGNTGLSTGAHLHWEVRVMGVPVDPMQWVREQIR